MMGGQISGTMAKDADPPIAGLAHAQAADGLPVSPALDLVADAAHVPTERAIVDGRVVQISLVAVLLGAVAAGVSVVFLRLIWFVTNLAFYQTLSLEFKRPSDNQLGWM